MDDVAARAGVSRALVSMALRDVPGVNPDTQRRILATAEQMGYRVNRVASRLASHAPNTFGVFLLDLRQDVYADVFDGIREVADAAGRHLVVAVGSQDGSRDRQALGNLVQSRVDVIIAVGLLLPDLDLMNWSRGTPIVGVAREVPGMDSACSDNRSGACLAVGHLTGLGHRRILMLSNPQTDGYRDRQRGYQETMRASGLEPWVIGSHYSREQACQDVLPVLALPRGQRPTAVFAHNDQAALGVLDAATVLGLEVPRQLSVVGYDNSMVSRAPGTSLTTVDIHGHDLGVSAARLAERRLGQADAETQVLWSQPSLVVRGTTAPPAD